MDNPLDMLERKLEGTTAVQLAQEIGVSAAYLSMVRRGSKPVGPKVLRFLGIEKQVTFRKINGRKGHKNGA
jgi:transcriptional regulator with XRE-family HTH domain